ncbi:alpha-2,8-polysialyltransferase family protein [Planococcus sp. A6]|uniref:polysialyltransferase family glycosyltransferase n=1 Tax=Planococcus sp. A6 TaxID=2992760 RepID=UPI00237BAF9A|nr:polysialyltransferase family glycosyltransferase [Planococcus sp. A6]MDE0582100.1 alpha-2,8-polysialyltransferase family protein [Planococcus sp. A6]
MDKIYVFSINTFFHYMIMKFYTTSNNLNNVKVICYSKNSKLKDILKKDKDIEGYIFFEKSKSQNKLLKLLENKNVIISTRNFLEESDFKELYVFKDYDFVNQTLIEYAENMGKEVTLLEDGLGLYTSVYKKGLIEKENIIKRILFEYPKEKILSLGINSKVDTILATSPNSLPQEVKKDKKIKELNFNAFNLTRINKVLSYFEEVENFSLPEIDDSKITIMYISQPFSELGILTIEEESEVLNELYYFFQENKKYNFLLKPHPGEKQNKYEKFEKSENVTVYKKSYLPAELVPLSIRIDAVLHVSSSSCHYINHWYNIQVLSLYKLFFRESKDDKLLDKLREIYEAKMVGTYDELESNLKILRKTI